MILGWASPFKHCGSRIYMAYYTEQYENLPLQCGDKL